MTKQIAKRAAAKAPKVEVKLVVNAEPLAAKLAKAKGKLPVPPPKAAQKAASAAPKALDDLPPFLDRKANGIQPAKAAPPKAAVAVLKAAQAGGGLTGMVATALLKGKGTPADQGIAAAKADDAAREVRGPDDRANAAHYRAAKAAPVAKGAAKAAPAAKGPSAAMPLTGKAALRAIAQASSAPVTKVAPGMTAAKAAQGKPSLALLQAELAKPGLTPARRRSVEVALEALGGGKAPKAKPAAAKQAKPRGRAKPEATGKITVLSKENPKRGGAAQRFALYKNGMTVAQYIAAAMKLGASESYANADVRWDSSHGFISVK